MVPQSIERRTFVKGASATAAAVASAPPIRPGRAAAAAWQRCIYSKGPFNLLADGPYDEDVDTISRELDVDKRARMTQALGQRLYDEYRGVMLGVRSLTWAVSKKVNSWQTLVYVPLENNYEYVS